MHWAFAANLCSRVRCLQEPERPVVRQAEAQTSRAPLQAQSSNVQPPAMAQALQPSSKPAPQPVASNAARLPLAQPSQQHEVTRHALLLNKVSCACTATATCAVESSHYWTS